VYLRVRERLHWAGLSPLWPAGVEVRVVYLPAEQEAAGASRSVTLTQSSLRSTGYALDSGLRLEGDGALLPPSNAGGAREPERQWRLRGSFVTHRLPAETGEDSPGGSGRGPGLLPADGPLARVDLRLSSGPEKDDVPIGVFLWSEDLARIYRPLIDDELAMVCLYEGPARWVSFFPARVSPLQAQPGRGSEPSGELLSFSIEPNRLDLRVRWSGSEPGTLEIHDAYWKGWRATVNGQPAEVRPSGPGGQGLWRQVEIPPGEAEVTLTYHPPFVGFSLALTMIGVICCVLICRPGRREPAISAPSPTPESASEKNSV
ncbi:hypothetical protein IIC65_05540, partial [Candidatus Sumerlaeota bacterium]|nr:hypothetical protein [Candidatus Sumerlaeota bacterium]